MKCNGALQGQSADWLIIIKAARRLLHWDSCLHCATFYGHAAGCGLEVLFLTVCRDSLCLSNELRFWLFLARPSGKGTVQCVGKGGNVTVWQACQTPSSFFHWEKLSGLWKKKHTNKSWCVFFFLSVKAISVEWSYQCCSSNPHLFQSTYCLQFSFFSRGCTFHTSHL